MPGIDHCLLHANEDHIFVSSVNASASSNLQSSTVYIIKIKTMKIVHSIALGSLVSDISSVPPNTVFGHGGFLLISTIKHKLNMFHLDSFEPFQEIDVQSNITQIHVTEPEKDQNSNSVFVAVCGQ